MMGEHFPLPNEVSSALITYNCKDVCGERQAVPFKPLKTYSFLVSNECLENF